MDFWEMQFLGNAVSSYARFAGIVVGSFLVARIARFIVVRYLAKWAEKTDSKWDDVIIQAVMAPAVWLVAVGGAAVAKEGLELSEKGELWFHRILTVLAITILFVTIFRLFKGSAGLVAEEYLKRSTAGMDAEEKAAAEKAAARVVRQVDEVVGMAIILLAVLTALSNLGVDLNAIWASLGVGGIALALAVKEPLANFFGRMFIYSSGLFDEGHAIQIDNWIGTVTRIGVFRTTLELASDLSTVSIPNAEFTRKPVKNNSGRKKFVFKWDLDVPYEIDADTLETLVDRLKELTLAKPEILPETVLVYVERLDKSAIVVRVWFQARLPDYPASTAYGSKVLGEIQRLFDEMKIAFAFPTYVIQIEGQGAVPKLPGTESR